jgi:hypothetical protein
MEESMQRKSRWQFIAAAICNVLLATTGVAVAAEYEVVVTNLTRGQTFTPILVATHKPGLTLFTLGEASSVELEVLAEGGDTAPLIALLQGQSDVLDVTDSGAAVPAGGSVTVIVRTTAQFDHVSVAAMLVPTNDGFFAINGAAGPKGGETFVLFSAAYDAGTEANDERCANIPGPPTICQGEGFNASRAGAEGFVHVHAGIHGIGDLTAAERDWRNPVARVSIRRIP